MNIYRRHPDRVLYEYLWFNQLGDPCLEGVIAASPLAALQEIHRREHRGATPPVGVMYEIGGAWFCVDGKPARDIYRQLERTHGRAA